jgi:hypothetical protein
LSVIYKIPILVIIGQKRTKMDNNKELIAPAKKYETSIVIKFSIKDKLYSRCLTFMKNKGFKESLLIQIALDKFLTEQNF